jgi:cytochrome bd ubiquinol oxidase subunit I
MDPVMLARIQFGMTIGFHFIFPPITIGMAWIIFYFMSKYKKTGDETYGAQARFWLKLFAINFAVGVATGITMEFQFGTNWARYSKFVGDIFGAPLAAEGILAFFLESTFMGVLLFGWHRFSIKVLWFASMMVAVGATISAFWIIVANSWMQTPAGFHIVNGRAELTSFYEAVFNPSTLPRFFHTMDSCMVAGSFFILGVSAWYLGKGQHVEFAKRSLKVSLVVGFIASVLQFGIGHWHGVQVAQTQPEKLAAFEAHYDTQKNAPMVLFGIPDDENEKVHMAVEIPSILSIMVGMSPDTEVKGLKDFPKEDRPPVLPVFVSFRLMFFLGAYFIALTGLGLLLLWKDKLYENKLFMKLAFYSLPLPIVAIELGWIAAEIGRQPWIVYHVPGMRTADAVSISVSAGEILFSIIMFGVIYLLLGFLWLYLLKRAIQKGPEELPASAEASAEATS